MKNCAPAVQALIAHGADLNKKNEPGNTALHLAASCNAKGFFPFLLFLLSSSFSFSFSFIIIIIIIQPQM